MGHKKSPVDLTIVPDGFTPDVDIFIRTLRGSKDEHDVTLIEWFENGETEKIMTRIREILSEMSISGKNASTIFEHLEKRLGSQSLANYSHNVMNKIMNGFRSAIENVIDGSRG